MDPSSPANDDSSSPTSETRKPVGREEVMKFPTQCSNCQKPAELAMHTTNIPHFKEIIIMSMVCDHCGFKTNEIKGGGGIPEHGSRITLNVQGPEDLNRDVLKSDSAGISLPDIELELAEGGLEGFYTTVEGLMVKLLESLQHYSANDDGDDSVITTKQALYQAFLQKLKSYAEGQLFPFTVVITDPLANSFVSPRPDNNVTQLQTQANKEGSGECYSNFTDPGVTVEHFQRSHEQNEILGLNDLKS
jgi:zinc finger protein